jgi:hypothetical protein
MKASRKAIAVKAALGAFLRPIAQDAAIGDLGALVRGVSTATIAQDSARIVAAVVAKLPTVNQEELAKVIKLAADGEPDDDKDGKPAQDDDDTQRPDESDEDYKKRMDAKKGAQDGDKDDKDGKAMDAAIRSAVAATEQATIQRMNSIRQAEKEVFPLIGEVVAQDSAEAVYKLALDAAKVDLNGVHPSAYGAMVRMLAKPAETKQPRVAMDAASETDFAAQYPTAGKLIRS